MTIRRLAALLLAVFALQSAAAAEAAVAGPCCMQMAEAGDEAPAAPCGSLASLSCCDARVPVSLPEPAAPPAPAVGLLSVLALPAAPTGEAPLATPAAAPFPRLLRSTVLRL